MCMIQLATGKTPGDSLGWIGTSVPWMQNGQVVLRSANGPCKLSISQGMALQWMTATRRCAGVSGDGNSRKQRNKDMFCSGSLVSDDSSFFDI